MRTDNKGSRGEQERAVIRGEFGAAGLSGHQPSGFTSTTTSKNTLTQAEIDARRSALAQKLVEEWLNDKSPQLSQDAALDQTKLTPEQTALWEDLFDKATSGSGMERGEAVRQMIALGMHEPSGDTQKPSEAGLEASNFNEWLARKAQNPRLGDGGKFEKSRKTQEERDAILARQLLVERAANELAWQEIHDPENPPALSGFEPG